MIKTTVLLKDINQFSEINHVYSKFFTDHEPARAAFQVGERREDVDGWLFGVFQVAALPKGGEVEIEAVALIGKFF